ncbi:MAG: hypothetical protein ACRD2B_12865 [Terriglobia bacterium]
MKLYLFVLFAVVLSSPLSYGQAWSGIIDPSRAIDWSGAGIPGGIPNRTTVCATVSPSGLTNATDMDNIDNAIASCAANEVVQLQAGTYTITSGLTFGAVSNVTLRGAGPDKTKLLFTGLPAHECGNSADVCLWGNSGWTGNYPGSTTWTAGYAKGANVITIGSSAGLSAGQIIILDQRDDSVGICPVSGGAGNCAGVSGATENGSAVTITTTIPHGYTAGQSVGIGVQLGNAAIARGYEGWFQITAVPSPTSFQYVDSTSGLAASGGGYATGDTGGLFMSNIQGVVTDEGESGPIGRSCPDASDPACAPGEISWRSQAEVKVITAINGNQITISPPLYMPNWRASQSPGIWWTGKYLTQDGIENLSLDYTHDGGGSETGGIHLHRTYECWVKNVRSIGAGRNHVWIREGSARDEVVDSYFFGTKGGAATSYGIEVYEAAEDSLIQNNICQHVVACLMIGGDWGSVYGYNYAFDSGGRQTDWLYPFLSENHDMSGMELFEGNDVAFASLDDVHGDGSTSTSFRNRFRGQDTPAKEESLVAAADYAFNRAENFIGNVMGTLGAETSEQSTALDATTSIWDLNTQTEGSTVPNDPLVGETLLRWGNVDVVTGTSQWAASLIPTSSFRFIDASVVPSTHTLPPSFYLSSRPAFWQTPWGTPPWPAIGPDVTGGTAPDGMDGYSYAIPAQLCDMHTPIDPAYQQTFRVSSASWAETGYETGTVTLTIGSNTLETGDVVEVSGISPSGYNGTYAVAAATSTTIRYVLANSPGTYASGGTAGYPNILLFNAANCYPADFGGSIAPPTGLTVAVH